MEEGKETSEENKDFSVEEKPLKPKEVYLDVRLLKDLEPNRVYAVKYLEELFGISIQEGLWQLLNQRTVWNHLGLNQGQVRYVGRVEDEDKKVAEASRMATAREMSRKIEKLLDKIVVGQTYSANDLSQIFNVRPDEGLFEYLVPHFKIEPQPDGNYKVLQKLSEQETKEPTSIGYNPLVKEVLEALRSKYGTGYFRFALPDIPPKLRKRMPPGLLPRIYDYLIDSGLLEEDPKRLKYYRIATKSEPTEKNS